MVVPNLNQADTLRVLVETEVAAQPLQLDRCFQDEARQRKPHEREGDENGAPHLSFLFLKDRRVNIYKMIRKDLIWKDHYFNTTRQELNSICALDVNSRQSAMRSFATVVYRNETFLVVCRERNIWRNACCLR